MSKEAETKKTKHRRENKEKIRNKELEEQGAGAQKVHIRKLEECVITTTEILESEKKVTISTESLGKREEQDHFNRNIRLGKQEQQDHFNRNIRESGATKTQQLKKEQA